MKILKALYHQIVSQIALQLEVSLSPNQQSFLETPRPVNPDAYRVYLEGVYYSETLTENGFIQALESFDKSLELDSLYAPTCALRFSSSGSKKPETGQRMIEIAE